MNDKLFKLAPALKDIIWGGTRLSRDYGKSPNIRRIAETWELSCHEDGLCTVAEGTYAGKTLKEVLGDEQFPTLIKLIDAEDNLSVQVHPAKTEMWVVVDCAEGASLVYGLKDKFNEDTFRQALANGTVESLLNYVPVHRGDVFFIPSGLVHAIGRGILIAEIQQSSNITYRVYDYGRLQNGKPRELHVEQALSTIRDFAEDELNAIRFSLHDRRDENELAACPYFTTSRIKVQGNLTLPAQIGWQCAICIGGSGTIDSRPIKTGDTYFALSDAGQITLDAEDEMEILLTVC